MALFFEAMKKIKYEDASTYTNPCLHEAYIHFRIIYGGMSKYLPCSHTNANDIYILLYVNSSSQY